MAIILACEAVTSLHSSHRDMNISIFTLEKLGAVGKKIFLNPRNYYIERKPHIYGVLLPLKVLPYDLYLISYMHSKGTRGPFFAKFLLEFYWNFDSFLKYTITWNRWLVAFH